MLIRPFRPDDEPSVIALWRACDLVRPWNDPGKDIARKLAENPKWLLVAERAGNVIGTCMAGYDGHRGWINYLAVLPEHQRGGCGRALMDAAEKILRSAGCAKINLQVRTGNKAAVAFYERIGFKVDEVVSMGKRLATD